MVGLSISIARTNWALYQYNIIYYIGRVMTKNVLLSMHDGADTGNNKRGLYEVNAYYTDPSF